MSAFQEYDCTGCGIDFDLCDKQILCPGQACDCSGCDGQHVAGKDGPTQTAIVTPPGSEFLHEWRDLPKDEAQKAAWIAESNANQVARDAAEATPHL